MSCCAHQREAGIADLVSAGIGIPWNYTLSCNVSFICGNSLNLLVAYEQHNSEFRHYPNMFCLGFPNFFVLECQSVRAVSS